MPTFMAIALTFLAVLIAGLFVPIYLVRQRLDFRARILDLLATAARRQVPFAPLLERAATEHRGRRRETLAAVAGAMSRGTSLSRALADHARHLFPQRVVASVQASEGTAQLPAMLHSLSLETTQALSARHRLSMTMFYPVCLGLFLIGMQTVYVDFAGSSRAALGEAETTDNGVLLSRVATGLIVAVWLLVGVVMLYRMLGWRIGFCQRLADTLVQRVKFLDHLARLAGAERLLRSTASLVGAGLSLPQALRRSAPATGNLRLGRAAVASAQVMEDGASAEAAWRRTLLPEFAALRAATATGSTPSELALALSSLATECGNRLTGQVDRCLRWVHPITIGLFGLLLAAQFAGVFDLIYRFHEEARLW
ncbi:MAG: type II secretion system F family protein [Planctomycetota bacterium]